MNRNQWMLVFFTSLLCFIVGVCAVPIVCSVFSSSSSLQIPLSGAVFITLVAIFVVISVHSWVYVRLSDRNVGKKMDEDTTSVLAELNRELSRIKEK